MKKKSHARYYQNLLHRYLIFKPKLTVLSTVNGGVKHWDKCKLRTALEWVVFTSSRTARLGLTKVLDAGKNWK